MRYIHLLFALFFYLSSIHAQQTTNTSLKEVLQLAETNYPLLKSKMLEVQAAEQSVQVIRTTFIPTLDAAYQLNYATHNNITGMAYPQLLIPISGPPSANNNFNGVFGSAASLLMNWQPITFGQRQSQVDVAKAGATYSNADLQNEIFRHKVNVINAWLDVLMATELLRVHEENVQRTEVNLTAIRTLVVTGIKPGVDTALLKAEVSKAKVELLNSRKYKEQAVIIFTQLLATDAMFSFTDSSYFNKLPAVFSTADSVQHPFLSLYNSSIDVNVARKKSLSKTTMPTLGVWSTLYARGSGVDYTGAIKATEGLGLQRYNYGLGLQLSIPILQSVRIKPQLQQQDYLIRSQQERKNEIMLQLKKQNQLADTAISHSLAVVKETPLFYESAAFSYKALLARYQSGLANFADLMQAQYGLLKAETENKMAHMAVWKAVLYKAAVSGNLNLFINQVN
jgi:outer membrane protein TolC